MQASAVSLETVARATRGYYLKWEEFFRLKGTVGAPLNDARRFSAQRTLFMIRCFRPTLRLFRSLVLFAPIVVSGCDRSVVDRPVAAIRSATSDAPRSGETTLEQQSIDASPASASGAPTASRRGSAKGDQEQQARRQASHQRMVRELAELSERMERENPFLGEGTAEKLRADLRQAASQKAPPSVELWQLFEQLGQIELRLGNEREAISHFHQAYKIGKLIPSKMPAGSAGTTFFLLGVGFMRLGETQNCCVQNGPESCLFPIRPSAYHTNPEGSKQAIQALGFALQLSSPESQIYKQSQWLLNIAHMTLGQYPDQVPDKYLIPPDTFAPQEAFPQFPNIAKESGVNTFSLSGGVVADDFDNDGDYDLLVSSWDHTGQLQYFVNDGKGKFTERTKEANLVGLFGGLNMVQADFNNDGFVDVLVLRGAWLAKHGQHPNSLLRNNGDGTFTDVTFLAGLGESHWPTQTGAWADYDLDGDLDLFVGNEPIGEYSPNLSSEKFTASQLFRNNGDETFTDVAQAAGVTNERFAKGTSWGDYDNDRWPDLYVSNLKGENRLYHNNGDGTFTDVAPTLGVTGPLPSFPTWFWDFDNDGQLDLFVGAYEGRTEHLVDHYLGRPVTAERPRLYRGSQGEFEDVAEAQKITIPSLPMGSNFGDLNNDGFLDFYLGTGDPNYQQLMPNIMYLNQGGARFADVTIQGGFGNLQKGHAVTFADFDRDGDQDIFEQMGGAFRGDRYYDVLFQNPGFENHWIAIKLIGTKSNRSGIGARIRLEISEPAAEGNGTTNRTIYRHVNSGGSFGCNPLCQHIGIGKATQVAKIEVFWPVSNTTQTIRDAAADRVIEIVEEDSAASR